MEKLNVCRQCLCAIKSREGPQRTTILILSPDEPKESTCGWCKESGFDTLFQID
ncbi:MAG: hypothetical protein II710_06635 [Clostridia bacterium]|nr:hypothetical protein [Clostridia bacterium]